MRMVTFSRTMVKTMAAACAVVLSLGLTACSSSKTADKSDSASDLHQIPGLSVSTKPGEEPKLVFHTPLEVEDGAYAIVQKGNGDTVQKGDRVCMQGVSYNATDGSKVMSTWEKNTPDCSVELTDSQIKQYPYMQLMVGQKINTTLAIGSNDTSSSSSVPYIMAMTIVSKSKDYKRATGEAVKDIPSNLPKVTLAKNGKPSIDMNGYQPGADLVVQPLIKGSGKTVESSDTLKVQYTGWLTNGKQFDSSWDRGEASSFSLSGVVKGWQEGLAGQTVGSQVLLVIPPDLGYGDQAQGEIPANSTLVFVVDILAAY